MKRINLLSYGFVRDESQDFEDDGNHFTCYRPSEDSKVRVSKLVSDGEVYLSGCLYGDLSYDEYSELPHYNGLDKLNGVLLSSLTDEAIINFRNACLEYEKEFREAESKIKWPTASELDAAITMIKAKRDEEYRNISIIFTAEKLLNLSNYDFDNVKRYRAYIKDGSTKRAIQLDNLDKLLNTYESRLIISGLRQELKDSYWYTEIIKIANK